MVSFIFQSRFSYQVTLAHFKRLGVMEWFVWGPWVCLVSRDSIAGLGLVVELGWVNWVGWVILVCGFDGALWLGEVGWMDRVEGLGCLNGVGSWSGLFGWIGLRG